MDDDELMKGPKKDFAGFTYAELIGVGAALLGIIASFMPWGKTVFGYIVTGIDLDGILTLVISFSALAFIVAWKDNETTRRTGVWVSALAAIMLLFTLYDLISFNSYTMESYSAGFYLQITSGVVLLVAGLFCLSNKKRV